MKKTALLLTLLLLALTALPALAQGPTPELRISLRRDFGYGGFDNKIQGRFSIHVSNPEDFTRIDYYIDEQLIDSRSEDSYTVQFRTDDFSVGAHEVYAIGVTSSGDEVRSNAYTRTFISSEEAGKVTFNLVVPILAVAAIAMALSAFVPNLIWRRKGFKVGDYGVAGGAVCSRCGKPFPRHAMAPNMVMGKLERCPHCGKWQIARRAAPQVLEAAEALLANEAAPISDQPKTESERERLERQIDESRFE